MASYCDQFPKKVVGGELPSLPKGEELCVVLIGKTGQGKSETGNMLAGKRSFEASDSTSSVTVNNQTVTSSVWGRELKIIDTPGCMDTKKGNEVLKEIAAAITANPSGFDAFLIVVKYPARMTNEEVNAIKQLEKLFGEALYDYSVVIFSHGDCFKLKQENSHHPMTFEEYVQKDMASGSEDSLGPLLRNVDGRAVLFCNLEKDPLERRKMVISLVEKIEEIKKKQGKRYDNYLFEKAREYAKKSQDWGQRVRWLYDFMLKPSWCNVM